MTGTRLVIIGGGNMGGALAAGLLDAGTVEVGSMAVVELLAERRAELEHQFDGLVVLEKVPPCEHAVVATKPGAAVDATRSAASAGARRVLSIAAGVTTATLDEAAGKAVAVIRAMPNLAALVGKGSAAITPGAGAGEADLEWAESILGAVGAVARLPEPLFDAFTAVAGSGPAYLFAVAEMLTEAAIVADLPQDLAADVVRRLFAGVASMLADGTEPGRLREMVTSPGGTTAAGLQILEERDVRSAFVEAVAAATRRSRELG
ncbi:MAG: pyrroline-5-carboxylate reductase [Actinomycetota bacterium]|nr:pyrroline-5-carboxylate reductase [Actinomycetota bacterium]